MTEKMDVSNILKTIEAVEVLGVAGKQIAKDGIGLDDLPKALELLKHYEQFASVVENFDVAIAEGKDIDSAEAVQVVMALIASYKKIKEA